MAQATVSIADVFPELVPSAEDLELALEDIWKPYHDYTRHVSPWFMAMNLESCQFVWAFLKLTKPERVCDFGSGFTSYLLRRWVQENGGQCVSVDDSSEWLDWTESFLRRWGVGHDNLELIDDFRPGTDRFDFIIYDYAGGIIRNKLYGFALDLLATPGFILLDDAHHETHAEMMRDACAERHVSLFGMKEWTCDPSGRFGALAVKT